jgi:NAD(P)H dehydrogenase (quinone)
MANTWSNPLLVSGASGALGRRVLAHLIDTLKVAPARIIAVTRSPEKLAHLAAAGVTVRQGSFDDPASLERAFAGAARLLLISTDAIGEPGLRLNQHRNAVAAAKAAGVRHVVYTSMIAPEPPSPIPFAPDHYGTEQALAASGLTWTILRNAWYMDNFDQNAPQLLTSGKWFVATGEGRVAYVSREDCARAAAAALASDSTENQVLTVSGPAALTSQEVAGVLTEATGKPVDVVQLTAEDHTRGLLGAGLPEPIAALLTAFDVNTRLGRASQVTSAVETLTGRAPQSFQSFVAGRYTAATT